jgi:hypothetical protein
VNNRQEPGMQGGSDMMYRPVLCNIGGELDASNFEGPWKADGRFATLFEWIHAPMHEHLVRVAEDYCWSRY